MRRGSAAVLAVAVAAPVAVAAGYAVQASPSSVPPTPLAVPTVVVTLERGTAAERIDVSGTLGFDGAYTVSHHGEPGVLTGAASPGSTVGRGEVLYTVAGRPVRLLLGAVPAYRDFGPGMADGTDVLQLERNLVELGLDPHHRITVDRHFSAATVAAIRRWQASWGWPAAQRTGRLSLGQVVFLPGPVRITAAQVAVGATVGPDAPVLTASSTRRVVTVPLGTDQQAGVRAGEAVQVSLPGADPLPGRVIRVGRVATAVSGQDPAQNQATIPVIISVALPRGGADLDQSPVQVAITTATHAGVLLVPVTALLARPGGGYQIRRADGTYVPVEPGMFDESAGLVEVSGAGLTAGQQVEVPAS